MNKNNPILLFAAAVVASVPVQAASLYSVTDFGANFPNAINLYGQVSGGAGINVPAPPFLWTPTTPNATTGTFVDLQPALGTGDGVINDYGEVLANSLTSAQVWKPTVPNGSVGTWTTLSGLQNGIAINASGQVAGYNQNLGIDHMALWSPTSPNGTSGSTVDLGDVPGHSQLSGGAIGYDINSRGQISGLGNVTNSTHGWSVLWSPNTPNGASGSMVALTNFTSYCGPINEMGQVTIENESNNFHLFLWTPTSPNATKGTLTDIGHLSNSFENNPNGMNSTGSIVGNARMTNSTNRAFLWEPDVANGSSGTIYDVNTLLAPADASNWTLQYAWDINDRGQIVGIASYDPDGPGGAAAVVRGVLLTPVPEPASCLLVTLGTFGFGLLISGGRASRASWAIGWRTGPAGRRGLV